MVHNYKRKIDALRYMENPCDTLEKAIKEVNEKGMSITKTAKRYGIAKETLVDRVINAQPGKLVEHPTVLSIEEEQTLIENFLTCSDWGFPLSQRDLELVVKSYLDIYGRSIPQFSLNLPSKDWLLSFFKRHHNILSNRIANNIKRARAAVSKPILEEYHQNLSNSLVGIPASNIFNYDEMNLPDNISPTKVLYRRDVKYPDWVVNSTKSCVTIMFCVAADGTLLPPFIVYKNDNIYPQWTRNGPRGKPCCEKPCCAEGCHFHYTNSGWFDMLTFQKWFMESFLPHAQNLPGDKAIIGDNLSSHFSMTVLREAQENNIKFICLPPNSTHLAQPLDVAFFSPLKAVWKKVITDFKSRYPGTSILNKKLFPSMVQELLLFPTFTPIIPANIISGFKATGIHPLDIKPLLQRLTEKKSTALLSPIPLVNAPPMPCPTPSPTPVPNSNMSETSVNLLSQQSFPTSGCSGPSGRDRGREKNNIPGRIITSFMMDEDNEMPPLEEESEPSESPETCNKSNTQSMKTSSNESLDDDEDNEEEGDDDEKGWEEMDGESSVQSVQTLCLFCEEIYDSPCSLFYHMEVKHQFSLKSMACHWSFDQLTYIKYINFIRRENPKPTYALSLKPHNWRRDQYMKPVLSNDPLLMFDVEEFYEYTEEEEGEEEANNVASLHATCDELREIVRRQREALRRLMEETHGGRELKAVKTVSDIDAEEDEGYFNSYAYFDIHHEMLSDKVRTEAYRDAIVNNGPIFSGKRVLDLGCGTAILSMFAASVGATVLAVDMSEVIFHAMEIVKENKLDKSITLRKGRLEDLNFSDKFDVIVSEWMGYFLLFEGMLDSVIYARNHYLAPGGYLLPNRCTLHLVGVEDMVAYEKFIKFWGNVYGFQMSCMVREVIKEASTEVVKKECICTTSDKLVDFDLMKVTPEDTEFSTTFALTAERDANLTCFVGYFDTYFDLPHKVYFSTGPHAPATHWKQTIFYLPQLKAIKKGEELKGTIVVKRKKREIRSLDVTIGFENKKYHYFVE